MANVNNIIVGAAEISYGGVNLGFTQGGVTLRKATEWFDVDADQLAGVAKKIPTMERLFVTTTLLEATFNNLQWALNEPDGNVSGSGLSIGSSSPVANEGTLTVVGKCPTGATNRTYTFYRAVSVEDVEHLIGARDQAGVIPVGFELLKDPSNNNKFGSFADA